MGRPGRAGTVKLSNPKAIFAGSPPRFTRSRVTYEAYVVSTTWTRPQVDSASSRFRTTRVFVRYMPLILQGKPVLLNKRDMFDADLNRLPPDEQEAVYAKMVPAPGRQGRQMFGVSVSPKKVSGPQLIRRYAHVSPTESDPIGRVELASV